MAASLRNAIIAALLGAAAFVAQAQERSDLPIQVVAKSSDFDYQKGVLKFDQITITQGDVRITADSAVANGLDFEDSHWEFSGNVRITMPESTLASDVARVRFDGGQIQSATVTGTPATFEQQRKEEHAQGRANRIDYDLGRGAVEFAGDAWLFDGRTEITGATLVYSTTNQRVKSQEPVVITIQPEEKQPETPKPPS